MSFIPVDRPGVLFAASRFGPACDESVFPFIVLPLSLEDLPCSVVLGTVCLLHLPPYTPDSRTVVQILDSCLISAGEGCDVNLRRLKRSGGSGPVFILCSTGRGLDLFVIDVMSFIWLELGLSIKSCGLVWIYSLNPLPSVEDLTV